MKKALSLILALALCLACAAPALAAEVGVSTQNLTVDGKAVDCEKYNIDGYNYFKLRDLAYLLTDTGSRFSVYYNADTATMYLTTGWYYFANGSELVTGEDKSSTAVESAQKLVIDGEAVTGISVYNIGGNNYFKLADLAPVLGFEVSYDEATRTAAVTSAPETLWVVTKETETDPDGETVTVWTYDAQGNALTWVTTGEDGTTKAAYTYDARGNQLTTICTDAEGNVWLEETRTYNAHDDMLTYKSTFYYDDGTTSVSDTAYTYTYDDAGNILTLTITSDIDGYVSASTETYTYDAEGNILTHMYTDGEGGAPYGYTYTYDAAGRMLTVSYASGERNWETTYTYDAAGNLLKAVEVSGDGTATTEYAYDASGNVLTETYTDTDGSVTKTENSYDAMGNCVKIVRTDADGVSTTEYTYDKRGNCLTSKTTDADGSVSAWTSTYDEHGNVLTYESVGADGTYSSTYEYTSVTL